MTQNERNEQYWRWLQISSEAFKRKQIWIICWSAKHDLITIKLRISNLQLNLHRMTELNELQSFNAISIYKREVWFLIQTLCPLILYYLIELWEHTYLWKIRCILLIAVVEVRQWNDTSTVRSNRFRGRVGGRLAVVGDGEAIADKKNHWAADGLERLCCLMVRHPEKALTIHFQDPVSDMQPTVTCSEAVRHDLWCRRNHH